MPKAANALRVALITDHDEQGRHLRELLEENGVTVVVDVHIAEFHLEQLGHDADVLLVNLDEETSHEVDRLELLIESSELPILFNEGGVPVNPGWIGKLVAKLCSMADYQPHPEPILVDEDTAVVELVSVPDDATAVTEAETPVSTPKLQVVRPRLGQVPLVWVLGASLGGPQAVKHFLEALPDDVPLSFIYAQHIGPTFVPLLAQQMQRVTGLRVMPATQNKAILPGEMLVVPVDKRFLVTPDKHVLLTDEPIPGSYKPCIDDVMEQVVGAFGQDSGAIIFSGMGDDGAKGARAMMAEDCTVFAQQADSCVISSMPDSAAQTGAVHYRGTPEALAERMMDYLRAAQPA